MMIVMIMMIFPWPLVCVLKSLTLNPRFHRLSSEEIWTICNQLPDQLVKCLAQRPSQKISLGKYLWSGTKSSKYMCFNTPAAVAFQYFRWNKFRFSTISASFGGSFSAPFDPADECRFNCAQKRNKNRKKLTNWKRGCLFGLWSRTTPYNL